MDMKARTPTDLISVQTTPDAARQKSASQQAIRDSKMQTKFMTAAQAAQLIQDGDTVGLMGGGGGLMEATHLFEAVQERFLSTQQPRDLTVMHALGIGDKKTKGMNCFAHEGLVKRVIAAKW
jgi:propionate CoA-transferase